MRKRICISTVGCQMNELDSQLVADLLRQIGYEVVESARKADVILFNTCSVRQHAEDKIYSALGALRRLKHRRRQTIGVLGCMAQKEGQEIFRRHKQPGSLLTRNDTADPSAWLKCYP